LFVALELAAVIVAARIASHGLSTTMTKTVVELKEELIRLQ